MSVGSRLQGRPADTQVSQVPYLPGLDGLRALAVVAVMLYHANHTWLSGGFLGVEVFFVISGYLITLLLLGERERTGGIDLKAFWTRRFRRLLPALITMITLLLVYLSLFFRKALGRTRGDVLAGFPFYATNWYQIWVGQGYTAGEAFVPLRHLWSLAVEEQFYLLWPLVMVVLLRRRSRAAQARLGLIFASISVAIALVVAVTYAGGDIGACSAQQTHGYWYVFGRCISVNDFLYLSSITRAGGILLGAGLAMVWRPGALVRGNLRHAGRQLDILAVVGLAVLAVLFWKLSVVGPGHDLGVRYDPFLFRGGFLITGLATVAVIMAVTHHGAVAGKLLGNRVLNWIGTRSYGLYLYHWPIYQIIRREAGVTLRPWQFLAAMAITVPITEASYRYIETPIRKGKAAEWWRSVRSNDTAKIALGAVGVAAVLAVASLATATNRCVGSVECSLERARTLESAPQSTDPPITSNPIPASTTAPPKQGNVAASTTRLGRTTTTVRPLPPYPYVAMGESVMAGAVVRLQSGGGLVETTEGVQAGTVVRKLRKLVGGHRIGPKTRFAFQIGTNGTLTDGELDDIMGMLPTQPVVFLTVHAPGVPWITRNNERIRALPARYKHVTIADWDKLAPSVKLCKDGIHISCNSDAMKTYANLVFRSLGLPKLVT